MKRINFLVKLRKKGNIELVEPSEEIKGAYISKSESNLLSAKILMENNKLEESIALTYYSMYHMLTALLFKAGIKCENHSASAIIMREVFSLDNLDIVNAKSERIDKQYYTGFDIVKQEVTEAIKNAELFNSKLLDFISRINNKDIGNYRKLLDELSKNETHT